MRAIGPTQQYCLNAMRRNRTDGCWYNGCGWYWNHRAGTIKIMESLFKRGLVTKTKHPELGCDVYTLVPETTRNDHNAIQPGAGHHQGR